MIPTEKEVNAWLAAMKSGHAVTEMMPRFVEGYKRLLVVADKARTCVKLDEDECYAIRFEDYDDCIPKLDALEDALNALEAPMPEVEGE